MSRPAVLLFDIDGTLVDCGGAGRRAMERGFERTHGRPDAVAHIAFGGMTDPAIVRSGLEHLGKPTEEGAIASVLDAYLAALEAELPLASGFRVIPFVTETLARVHTRGHVVGLGTGNLKRGADLKLRHAGLAAQFSFGGFACDAEDRAELLRRGRERGLAVTGPGARVVIIGDTPKDVAAARAIGAECLAVATGRFSLEELERASPTLAVSDLGDARARAFLE